MNSRVLRAVGPAILLVTAGIALLLGLIYGGGAAPTALVDSGPVVRWGLPVAQLVLNLATALMIGSLVLALFAMRAGTKTFERALDIASTAAAAFTVSAGVTGFLTGVNLLGLRVSIDGAFGADFARYVTGTNIGRLWLIATVMGAVVSILTFATRAWTPTIIAAALAIATLIPVANQGHSGEQADHHLAVASIGLHTLGAAVWLGGLMLVVLIRPMLGAKTRVVLERYSSLALAAFIVVSLSGLIRGAVGLGTIDALFSPYGVLMLAKAAALVAMGVIGAMYRSRLIAKTADERTARPFWTVVTVELVFMGIASGAAAALARTAPPVGVDPAILTTPAEILTNQPLPPELNLERWFTVWDIDVLWAFAVAFGLFFYLAGVWRLHRRGDRWPIHRTVFWLLGMALLFWVTSGAPNAYQDYLFSVHMLGHMLLSMAIPLLLVSAAPITLAARAVRKRDDGTRGGREWILWAVHTPFARVVTHPLVAAGVFVGSLWVFYFTDLYRWALYDHLGHQWMVVHFLISGYLFVMSLIGIDPVPYRLPHAGRLITLIAVMAIHAFFGVAIMMQTGLMGAEWYGSMGRTWGSTPYEDQYAGGGIAWSVGEIPTLVLAITVAIQWSRSDERAQRRADRHADRTGDAELTEYNAKLARIAERDAARGQ